VRASPGKEKEGEEREGLCIWKQKWRNSLDNNGGKLIGGDGVRRSREENHRLAAN
jgi:hypothetical protein